MAIVKKIKLPDNTVVDINDPRISGVDSTPTSGSTNVVTSGGVQAALTNGSVTKVGTATVGASNRPIYLNAGVPTVTDPGEAFLSWGGQSISGNLTPVGMSLSAEHSANRTAYINGDLITAEYSSNGGSSWTAYSATASAKSMLFTKSYDFPIGRPNSNTDVVANQSKTRITLTAQDNTNPSGRVYTAVKKMLVNVSSATALQLLVELRTGANYINNGAWSTFGTYTVSGWSGWSDIPLVTTLGGGTSQTSQYWQLRLTFTVTSVSSSYPKTASVLGVRIFGQTDWFAPSNMAATGHLYSYDESQNATFPAKVTASQFVKSGGTSSQFLKADGSVDSNTYATTSQLPPTVTESTVSGWGFTKNTGTLTGVKFNGTSASVSGGVASITATIPSAPGTLITNATSTQTASSGEAMSGSITLHKVAKTGTYSDLIGKPTIPSAPGTLNTTATTAQSTSSSEALSGSITLHKVAKTGTYSDLVGKPTIPAAPGTLNTTAVAAQSTSSSESLSGIVTLHKVSKTGSYSDLLNKPTIDTTISGQSSNAVTNGAIDAEFAKVVYLGEEEGTAIIPEIDGGGGSTGTETDPVFSASPAAGITSADITNWNAKQKAITVSSSEPTSSQGSNGDIWIVI